MSAPRYVRQVSLSNLVALDDGRSHPFPVSQVPELLRTRMYFVERFSERAFLRSLKNPYFLREVNFADIQVEIPNGDVRSTGRTSGSEFIDLKLMWVQFTPDAMTIGYDFRGDVRWFVPVTNAERSISSLDEETQTFYDSVDLEQSDEARRSMLASHAFTAVGV